MSTLKLVLPFVTTSALFALMNVTIPSNLLAHRIVGRTYPTLATALIQSPSASVADLPVALWDTGLSVICVKVTNTSRVDTRITAIGLELPGSPSGFSLVTPLNMGLTLQENVGGVPGFPGVALDLALVSGGNSAGGRPRLGLAPNTTPTTLCVSGPFDRTVPIETMLNGVFVRFESGDSISSASDIGVWERR